MRLAPTCRAKASGERVKTNSGPGRSQWDSLFGGSRYNSYHMELTLGDDIDHYTLEHFQASDNRLLARGVLARRSKGPSPFLRLLSRGGFRRVD